MKIVFLGTPEFAVPSLDILVQNGYDISAVVTAPGKKAGRGLQVREPAVKLYADNAGLNTLQPTRLTDPEFIATLKALNADLFIVVAFRMLPDAVWQMPPLGTFNLHASLLPQYRGAAPINRVIMNGETETGLTTFFLQHDIDTGNIIFREKLPVFDDETAGELHDRLKIAGAHLILKTVRAIEQGTVKVIKQETLTDGSLPLRTAPKIFNEDCRINWHAGVGQVHNLVRGLSPHPGAYTQLKDASGNLVMLKIYRSKSTDKSSGKPPGSILVEDNRLFIQCGDRCLEILEVQQEGKKRIPGSNFISGFRMEKGWSAVSGN